MSQISAAPAALLPVHLVHSLCQRFNALLIVDGAHGPGNVEMSLDELPKTQLIYVATCAKWLMAPRGAAFIFVPDESLRHRIRPLVMHDQETVDFQTAFHQQGLAYI